MPRAQSIYERETRSILPPPELRERSHLVKENEGLIIVATVNYGLEEYNPELWRLIGLQNGVVDPFTFNSVFTGRRIRIPARPLPSFT